MEGIFEWMIYKNQQQHKIRDERNTRTDYVTRYNIILQIYNKTQKKKIIKCCTMFHVVHMKHENIKNLIMCITESITKLLGFTL